MEKTFNDVAGKLLLEKGFKKKRNVYYRVTEDELLQVASFGWTTMKNYDIHFDILPMYAEHYKNQMRKI